MWATQGALYLAVFRVYAWFPRFVKVYDSEVSFPVYPRFDFYAVVPEPLSHNLRIFRTALAEDMVDRMGSFWFISHHPIPQAV